MIYSDVFKEMEAAFYAHAGAINGLCGRINSTWKSDQALFCYRWSDTRNGHFCNPYHKMQTFHTKKNHRLILDLPLYHFILRSNLTFWWFKKLLPFWESDFNFLWQWIMIVYSLSEISPQRSRPKQNWVGLHSKNDRSVYTAWN